MKLPRVGLVICTYLEQNQRYLDECLKSIKNLNYPKERLDVCIVSSGEYVPATGGYRNVHSQRQTHYPESINIGVSKLSDDCDFYLLLNDDTILSKNSLFNLVNRATPHAIYQPISTCDNGWRYLLPMPCGLVNRFYRYDDLVGRFYDIANSDSLMGEGFLIVNWVPLYATLIPKNVWNIVGPLDPKFKTGQDDVDYGLRAKAKGIPCLINLSSFIFHFGGATADVALTPEIRQKNIDYFKSKYNGDMPI